MVQIKLFALAKRRGVAAARWVDEWVGGWVDGWVGGWVGGWMDGWVAGRRGGTEGRWGRPRLPAGLARGRQPHPAGFGRRVRRSILLHMAALDWYVTVVSRLSHISLRRLQPARARARVAHGEGARRRRGASGTREPLAASHGPSSPDEHFLIP